MRKELVFGGDSLGSLGESLGIPLRSTPFINTDSPATHLKFRKRAPGFAMVPHARRHVYAESMGIRTRLDL